MIVGRRGIGKKTNSQTDRQPDGQTDRQTDRDGQGSLPEIEGPSSVDKGLLTRIRRFCFLLRTFEY